MRDNSDEQISRLLQAFAEQTANVYRVRLDPKEFPAGREILALDPELGARIAMLLLMRAVGKPNFSDAAIRTAAAKGLLSALLRKPLPLPSDEFAAALSNLTGRTGSRDFWDAWHGLPLRGILRAWAKRIEQTEMTPRTWKALNDLRTWLRSEGSGAPPEVCAVAIDAMLGEAPAPEPLALEEGEAWSDLALSEMSAMPAAERNQWKRLLEHSRTAKGARPTKKWMKVAAPLLEEIGRDVFAQVVTGWFSAFPGSRSARLPPPGQYHADRNLLIADANADILKGIGWCCSTVEDISLARALADAIASGFKKIANFGPRCPKVANAALLALAAMPGSEPPAQLGRLAAQVKQPTGLKNIQKALSALAVRTGQTIEDLTELAIPTFDLDENGGLSRKFGEVKAQICIDPLAEVSLSWIASDGKPRKTIPQSVKRDNPDSVKALQRTVKDLQKMLAAQRARLERLMISERTWPLSDWRKRYHDHPLVGQLSKRLIWRFQSDGPPVVAAWVCDRFVTYDDQLFQPLADATVRLWHPILSDSAEVLAWRAFLERHRIVQPFKQSHREIYVLTDAERDTAIYSNRFAGHILRQHQFVALCQQRGWKTGLQGAWDGGDQTPTLDLPNWNLKAEFWTEIVSNDEIGGSGVALHLSTDQVRFNRADDSGVLPLEQIHPLVLSEVMRDVDLFVGVASVGNDPTWQDGGPNGRYRDYWQGVSFGDLSATAQTRKAVLESLLPRLRINDRAHLTERFLVVRGNLRTYKIHLGSSNILMMPNDQYLCIVPSRGSAPGSSKDNLYLPFEGDHTLAVILSKAFMLADDEKISDQSIVNQIRR